MTAIMAPGNQLPVHEVLHGHRKSQVRQCNQIFVDFTCKTEIDSKKAFIYLDL